MSVLSRIVVSAANASSHWAAAEFVLAIVFLAGLVSVASSLYSYFRVIFDVSVPNSGVLVKYGATGKQNSGARPWAIVTGPTAGIGEEFAKQLAKKGLNLGLVGRNPTKLAEVEDALKKYGIETSTFVLDAETASAADFDRLGAWASGLPNGVSVLINNMGVSHSIPVPFAEVDDAELRQIVNVNVMSTIEVTRVVLPTLQAFVSANRDKRRRALVLTMGSFAGLMPTPLLAVYSGSKAFLQGWNTALAAELEPQGIDAQLILSYLVTSKMSKIRRSSLTIPDCKTFVASALRSIGRRGGAQERAWTSTPFWAHALLHWFVAAGPGVFSAIVARLNLGMHVDIRRRALRKAAKNK